MKLMYKFLMFDPSDSYEYVILSINFTLCEPYFPTTKFILRVVIAESVIEGIWISFPVTSRYLGIFLPMRSENSKGVPQLLHLHEILVFSPNLNPKVTVPAVVRQLPSEPAKENAVFPPIVNKLAIL